jgi:hypothetical protein
VPEARSRVRCVWGGHIDLRLLNSAQCAMPRGARMHAAARQSGRKKKWRQTKDTVIEKRKVKGRR